MLNLIMVHVFAWIRICCLFQYCFRRSLCQYVYVDEASWLFHISMYIYGPPFLTLFNTIFNLQTF